MARRTRSRIEVGFALLFFLAIVVAGGVALFVAVTEPQPVYSDPEAVPSTVAFAPAERYAGAVEEARRLARALLVNEQVVPALSVAVAVNGEIVWAEGFGYADTKRHTPVTPRTRFRTGSVSKTLTAAAVALLYDRKRIDLHASVQTYVPAYPKKPWTVTTRQLLGDVAGIHRIRGDNNDQVPRGMCTTVDAALKTFAYEPLAFEPGTKYRYSTSGWILLSAVIEGAAGQPFATFMSREVFEPLGMDRTALEGTDTDPDTTVSFDKGAREDVGLEESPVADYGCFFGAGAFLSTPTDLVRLGTAMARPGLLKAETIALFETPLQLASGASTGFALGWKVDRVPLAGAQVRVIHHRAGFIGGAGSLSVFPERGLVVAATQSVSAASVDPFALQVADAFTKPAQLP